MIFMYFLHFLVQALLSLSKQRWGEKAHSFFQSPHQDHYVQAAVRYSPHLRLKNTVFLGCKSPLTAKDFIEHKLLSLPQLPFLPVH